MIHRFAVGATVLLATTAVAVVPVAPATATPARGAAACLAPTGPNAVCAHPGPTALTARACGRVRVGRKVASAIRTNLGCARARGLVRQWLRRRRLPHNQFGWYCAGRRNVTCGGGNGGNAPYVRFRYRR